jgi:ABC-type phosphate transport system ATPase subunit
MSIFDNVVSGLILNGAEDKKIINEIVMESLEGAALWEEVKDELNKPGMSLSGGQQQRLCIDRAVNLVKLPITNQLFNFKILIRKKQENRVHNRVILKK